MMLFAAVGLLTVPAQAADTPAATWTHDNPFCDVMAAVAPVYDGSGYGLSLFAARGKTLDAHVTLVSDTDAYDAHISQAPLTGSPTDLQTRGVIVRLPAREKVRYFFVDSYALDGGQTVICPSYVFAVGKEIADAAAGVQTVDAVHLQAVGTPACGHMYEAAGFNGDPADIIGHYGNRPLTAVVRVYIDSKGQPMDVKLVTTSGVEGVDDFALGAFENHRFKPAQFLCTPVVGQMLIHMIYEP